MTVLTGCASSGPRAGARPQTAQASTAVQLAASWLARYVDPDGRVVRRDQGGDTVSEGQSYALALSLVTHDAATAGRVWTWTKAHLLRPDGLLSFHTDPRGTVLDTNAATDADLVTAWALLRQADPTMQADGRTLAAAVLGTEVVRVGSLQLLAAGPWATGQPATLNPSYWAFPVLRDLTRLTGDPAWGVLAHDADAALAQLPDPLAPDWLRADGAALRAEPAPDGSTPEPQHGLDAQRVELWSAAGCTEADRAASARAETLPGRTGAIATNLHGKVLNADVTPVGLLAADQPGAAAALAEQSPTYYGDAWVALRAAMSAHLLAAC